MDPDNNGHIINGAASCNCRSLDPYNVSGRSSETSSSSCEDEIKKDRRRDSDNSSDSESGDESSSNTTGSSSDESENERRRSKSKVRHCLFFRGSLLVPLHGVNAIYCCTICNATSVRDEYLFWV